MTENLIIMNIGDSDILYSFDRARLIDRARNGFMRIDGITFKRARDYMAKYKDTIIEFFFNSVINSLIPANG